MSGDEHLPKRVADKELQDRWIAIIYDDGSLRIRDKYAMVSLEPQAISDLIEFLEKNLEPESNEAHAFTFIGKEAEK